jgi:hypothetical protein
MFAANHGLKGKPFECVLARTVAIKGQHNYPCFDPLPAPAVKTEYCCSFESKHQERERVEWTFGNEHARAPQRWRVERRPYRSASFGGRQMVMAQRLRHLTPQLNRPPI